MQYNYSEVTIVVISHNRPLPLKLVIGQIIESAPGVKILIIDSSSVIMRKQIKTLLYDLLRRPQVEIFYLPSRIAVFEKYKFAIKEVDTEFVQFYSDDDVVCVDYIIERCSYLKNHKDVACCLGRHMYGSKSCHQRRERL